MASNGRRHVTAVVYVGCSGTGDISVLELASDGTVRSRGAVSIPGLRVPTASLPLAVSPDVRWLFAASRSAPFAVTTFAIDVGGGLSVVAQAPLPASMAYLATDRRGRYLFGAAYDEALVSSCAIDPSGAVGPTLAVVATAPGAHAIQADPANARVLHTSLGGDLVYQSALDEGGGELVVLGAVKLPRGAGPRHFVFSSCARHVFVLGELDGHVYTFPYDSHAGLSASFTHVASALPDGFTGEPWASDLHLTRDGSLLFASERTSSTLVAFRVELSSGRLTRLGSWQTAEQPRAFAIEPSGRYLLAAGERSDTLRVHAIDAGSGALTPLGEHAVGASPSWVEIVELPSSPALATP